MQVGFDFTVFEEIVNFLLHKVVLKAKLTPISSKIFYTTISLTGLMTAFLIIIQDNRGCALW